MWKPWWPAPRRRWLAWSRAAERLVRLVPRFSRTQSAAPGTEPLPPGPAFFCHQRGDSTISDARELAFVSRSTGVRGWGCRSRAARRETAELLRGRHESGRTRPSRRAATGGRDEPDIFDSRVKQSAQYLADILALNRAVDASFFGYSPLPTAHRHHPRRNSFSGQAPQRRVRHTPLQRHRSNTLRLAENETRRLVLTGTVFSRPNANPKGCSQQHPILMTGLDHPAKHIEIQLFILMNSNVAESNHSLER